MCSPTIYLVSVLFFGCSAALGVSNRNLPPRSMISPNEGLQERLRVGHAEGRAADIFTASGSGNVTTTSDVVAAYEGGGTDLEAFVEAAQLALLNDDSPPNGPNHPSITIRYQIRVRFCQTLRDFLASRTEAYETDDGMIRALVNAFVEPDWKQANHLSSVGTSLAFAREPHVEEGDNGAAGTTTPLERAMKHSPTVALKLIRREAIEELRCDRIQKLAIIPADESNNHLQDGSENANDREPATGPGSGDTDAARRINQLAVEWAIRRHETDTTTATIDNSGCSPVYLAVICQDDRILSTKDATTHFVQSRVSVKVATDKTTKTGRSHLELTLQSPSLATPISGVRPRGTGCTFCKVVIPQSIDDALAAAGCDLSHLDVNSKH